MPKISYTSKSGKRHTIELSSALKYPKDHPAYKAAATSISKKSGPTSDDKKSSGGSSMFNEEPPVPPSPTGNHGPKDDSHTISKSRGSAEKERKVVSNLIKLAELADEAKKKGIDPPNFDLCQVSLPGTNLFCQDNLGIPRKKMPQLKSIPVKGGFAEKMALSGKVPCKKNDDGSIKRVDMEPLFKKYIESQGIKMEKDTVPADELKATQSQLVGAKIAEMTRELMKDPNSAISKSIREPIFVSKDGYILDGHHRWAALVGLQMANGSGKDIKMNVVRVDIDGKDLVDFTNEFCNKVGLKQQDAVTSKHESVYIDFEKRMDEAIRLVMKKVGNSNKLCS